MTSTEESVNAMEFTTEHRELRSTVRRFLSAHSAETNVRALMHTETGHDPAVWKQMASMGLTGLAIPEEFGGAGYGWTEVGIVLEEAGRSLLCAPYFSTVVLATAALLASADQAACKDFLPEIADGTLTATLAVLEESGSWRPADVALNAQQDGDSWTLTGVKNYVLDGHSADLVLVAARTGAGVSLFAVDSGATGLARTPVDTLDLTRKQARLEFSATPARLIGIEGSGEEILRRSMDVGAAGLAAEQLGGAQYCLDLAVEYAKVRYQFGRPIGSFQAVQHLCADMLVEVESARSAVLHAIRAADSDPTELAIAASLAQAYVPDAYFVVVSATMQVLGGVGFTWEHPAHLYLKRAKSGQHLLGDAAYHRALLAELASI